MMSIHLKDDATPVFMQSRPVPYALRKGIEAELERLENEGTIKPVEFSDWATPIVPIMKSDSSLRICGDYKLTVNKVSRLDSYPIPKVDELFTKLAGGQKYSELDLSHAYEQILLDESSCECVTINTHRGLFQYQRLPYGVSSSPGIFQRIMECLLQGMTDVAPYLDNVIITGKDDEEHLKNLALVLEKISQAGLRLKRSKCQFMKEKIVALGHVLSGKGIQPCKAKVEAIQNAPAPTNVTELRAYLGLINYYHRYLRNLSTVLAPLHDLLRKGIPWSWNASQQKAFDTSKQQLCSETLLVHYDLDKKFILSCNASPYDVGAVLSHVMEDGSERPIGFVS